jgi:hypothetical protein
MTKIKDGHHLNKTHDDQPPKTPEIQESTYKQDIVRKVRDISLPGYHGRPAGHH